MPERHCMLLNTILRVFWTAFLIPNFHGTLISHNGWNNDCSITKFISCFFATHFLCESKTEYSPKSEGILSIYLPRWNIRLKGEFYWRPSNMLDGMSLSMSGLAASHHILQTGQTSVTLTANIQMILAHLSFQNSTSTLSGISPWGSYINFLRYYHIYTVKNRIHFWLLVLFYQNRLFLNSIKH